MSNKIVKTEQQWQKELDEETYRVTREKGTEAPFSGRYNDCHTQGTFNCACCGLPLFESLTKYDSGSGWPSFYKPAERDAVTEINDESHGMTRTEVVCSQCEAHLGHVFPDGPAPTGLRYCINSVSLSLKTNE